MKTKTKHTPGPWVVQETSTTDVAVGEKGGSGLFHFLEKLTPQQIAYLCEKAAK